MRKITKIIVHCTATPEGRQTTVADIDKWHRERGFAKIGYHYVVYLDGSMHQGRQEEEAGAHCLGYNADSIGVCYVGGLDQNTFQPKDTRTPVQKNTLADLIQKLVKKYPGSKVYGHRDFAAKACPCFDAKKEYNPTK